MAGDTTLMAIRMLGYDPPQHDSLVVVLNRQSGLETRTLLNECEVVSAMRAAHVHVVAAEPGQLTLADQVLLGRTASVVVGPHGSNLANLAFVHEGASLVEILPAGMQTPWFSDFCAASGIRYFTGNTFNLTEYRAAAAKGGSRPPFYHSMSVNATYVVAQVQKALDPSYVPHCKVVVDNRMLCE